MQILKPIPCLGALYIGNATAGPAAFNKIHFSQKQTVKYNATKLFGASNARLIMPFDCRLNMSDQHRHSIPPIMSV